ncbi:MAG: peptidylprolyl isomerase [Saprospiraceae bacterium]
MKILTRLLLAVILVNGAGCIPPSSQKNIDTYVGIDFSDANFQKLYNFQDRLLSDSLIQYFKSDNPNYRYMAALSFGSIKDPKALLGLEQLLADPVEEVRVAAAYAIGQIGDSTATNSLVKAFQRLDTMRLSIKSNAAILEAIGKTAPAKYLKYIAAISTYKSTDTLLLNAQSYATYRFMLRKIVIPEGTNKMLSFVFDHNYPQKTRLIASNYLSRVKDIELDSLNSVKIATILNSDPDYRIRMALATSLGKSTSTASMYTLINLLEQDSDYRVKLAAIQSLGHFDYIICSPVIRNYLYASNLHLSQAAANYFINNGQASAATTEYWPLAKDTLLHPIIQIMMYQATNKFVSPFMANTKGWVNAEIQRKLNSTSNTIERIAALRALSEYGWNYKYIKEIGLQMQAPIARTSTVEILGDICRRPDFYRVFSKGPNKVRIDMFSYMLEIMGIGDPGMIAAAASVLRIPEMGFKYFYWKMYDRSFLNTAQEKLNLPKDLETWNEIQMTIDYFNAAVTPTTRKIPDFNQPIDWKLLNSYSQSPIATMQTKYGNVIIELLPARAPGTVVNFIQLSNNNFYNGKTFHRVVGNFVVQGGCPRGDGYGALDYSIRSELPPMNWDDEGYLGMASSGNHTEGTQLFITTAPALHLDGNYTIFGKVKSGMEFIHRIQQGDVIEKIIVK